MRREPDRQEDMIWKGYTVTVRVWCEPTDIPWEDAVDTTCCGETPPNGAEGWDLAVEVELTIGGETFRGLDSLGSVWGERSYVKETLETQVIPEALASLETEIKRVSRGDEVKLAEARQGVATLLVSELRSEQKELAI